MIVKKLVDKMLEPYGVNYDYVVENQFIEGEDWYMHYTWDTAEERDFRTWAVKEIRKHFKCTKEKAEKEYDMFNLMWGLRLMPND